MENPQGLGKPRFCVYCGNSMIWVAGQGSARCRHCDQVSYRNPAVGVAVIIFEGESRVLLGRRGRGRYAGLWCVPCGYVEWGEDVRAAAQRELREETGLLAEIGEVIAVHSNFHEPERLTVGIWFRGRVHHGDLSPGDDLEAVEFYSLFDLPALAFPTDATVLLELRRQTDTRPAVPV